MGELTLEPPFTNQRVVVSGVSPEIEGGRHPAKCVVGEVVAIEADVFCDSHDALAAVIQHRDLGEEDWFEVRMEPVVNDRWRGAIRPEQLGLVEFRVVGWVDRFGTWRRDLAKKHAADVVEAVDFLVGAELAAEFAKTAAGDDRRLIEGARETLVDADLTATTRVDVALDGDFAEAMFRADPRRFATEHERTLRIRVDRERARFSTWYELFPRSAVGDGETHGTFRDVIDRLPYVAGLGFDVLYFPPIHPIGEVNRKGPNNATTAEEGDLGSPWAIGSKDGGHKDVHPALGTIEDFRDLRDAAAEHGLELAMDIAFQAAPDHPYVDAHPNWFRQLPDGTIRYAENPPKKYQDIYPFDFETEDAEGLWVELKSVFDHWIDEGIRIFRVDNPHTKSFPFWEWCISEVTREHPDVIFLAEAFTRPKVMKELAKRGFTQSYTYFSWRQQKWEIEQYYTELNQTDVADYFRSNAWPNTPDILTEQLQYGGRSMYLQRLILAATLSANYGMYGPAFELMWSEARPGAEEYLDNEKYQLRAWDLDAEHSLAELIRIVNAARHEHPALQQDRTLRFHHIENEQLLVYSKTDPARDDVILCVVNLDPNWTQSGWTWLDMKALGLPADASFQVHDLIGDARYLWSGRRNYVELDPHVTPGHIFVVRNLSRTERDFDYYL